MKPKLPLGQLMMTAGVSQWADTDELAVEVGHCIYRHERGDWGDVRSEDAAMNDEALGNRVLSSYEVAGRTIWIITEYDRSVTTILFPSEY